MSIDPLNLPDTATVADDDTEILRILDALGFRDYIVSPTTIGQTFTRTIIRSHPTHWVSVECFEGWPNPVDNGLKLELIPKHLASWDQVKVAAMAANEARGSEHPSAAGTSSTKPRRLIKDGNRAMMGIQPRKTPSPNRAAAWQPPWPCARPPICETGRSILRPPSRRSLVSCSA